MSKVFVIDTKKQPLNPVHPGRARKLLSSGQAAVYRRFPFTIILKYALATPVVQSLRVKLDPGSKTTGIAVINDANGDVIFAATLVHRGNAIKKALDDRRRMRQRRRYHHTRYRKARLLNRRRPQGWLPPSLESRIANVMTWVRRLQQLCPIGAISQELVRFDTQIMQDAEIRGSQYQQGTLAGYEVRAYLLEKWQRTCAYCGTQGVPLQIEHIVPHAKGGTNSVSNLTLACEVCNTAKGTQAIEDFLKQKPEVLKRILAHTRAPLKNPAAVNATRWALYERLKVTGLPIEVGTGGRTQYNRVRRDLPKTHWMDAVCVGASTPETVQVAYVVPLHIKAMGHGLHQRCIVDKYGFPRKHRPRKKRHHGFQTGDMVKANVPASFKTAGVHVGRIATRTTGSFNISTATRMVQGVSHRYCTRLQRDDGYSYSQKGEAAFLAHV